MRRIYHYMRNNPNKLILGTGDTQQLPPREKNTNVKNTKKYLNDIVNLMFPNLINLQINKRLKSIEDREKLKEIKRDIFNYNLSVRRTFSKNFKMTNKIETLDNLSYTRNMAKDISMGVRRRLKYTDDYHVNEVLVCSKRLKLGKEHLFHVNMEHRITKITGDSIILDDEFKVSKKLIMRHFSYSYCRAVHSYQGIQLMMK